MAQSPDTLLSIYLNDHLAGATAGRALVRRVARSNPDGELGELLARLVGEIDEDREQLRSVLDRVGAGEHPLKPRLAWLGERLGRLKLNGQLTGYSPLSRALELEGLSLAIEGKALLWRTLGDRHDPRLDGFDFELLAARARSQREELEPHRLAAGRSATASGRPER